MHTLGRGRIHTNITYDTPFNTVITLKQLRHIKSTTLQQLLNQQWC